MTLSFLSNVRQTLVCRLLRAVLHVYSGAELRTERQAEACRTLGK